MILVRVRSSRCCCDVDECELAQREPIFDDFAKIKKQSARPSVSSFKYTTGQDREYEFDAEQWSVVLAARSRYDPFALLDVLTTIDSIDPAAEQSTLLMNVHPSAGERLIRSAAPRDGKPDVRAYARAG